jgi:alpha-D-xyloside xylohydrolase
MLSKDDGVLKYRYDDERLQIQAWGPNAFRVRCTKAPEFPSEDWALSQPVPELKTQISLPSKQPQIIAGRIHHSKVLPEKTDPATIQNGKITATLTTHGKLTIQNNATGQQVLEEYNRNRADVYDPKGSALTLTARAFKAHGAGAGRSLTYTVESQSPTEKIYGMGQYQQPYLNLKGLDLELAQRNSQASVPFYISSLGYGFLWNNPSVGRAVLGKHTMKFEAKATEVLDFWIVVGDTPRDILAAYADVTGHTPMMPEYGLGFWQCKLRYQTQVELLGIAREYKKRELPIDVIVVDYFHWPLQGEWKFDPNFWPDPKAMVKELADMNIKLLVSIWPTVDLRSENYNEMVEMGHLTRVERGIRITRNVMGQTVNTDFTNPETKRYVWDIVKKNYFDLGIRCFWLDEAEPSLSVYDYENYGYHKGTALAVGNRFPVEYAQAFFEGQTAAGQGLGGADGICNLIRCAWAGSQRYATLVWSGDIWSTWGDFKNQIAAGLNMGMAGIPWWTTDIGGFDGGDPKDPAFQELLVRWFQWGAFCPVMRLHGNRIPKQDKVGEGGGSDLLSGAANEVWSYGDDNYPILVRYMRLRERLRDYTRSLMKEASETGAPLIRTMFFEFPEDDHCWETDVDSQYMYGGKYLCAPVLEPKMKKRSVYLPKGTKWALLKVGEKADTYGKEYDGGQTVEVDTPIEDMPVFVKLQ